MRNLQVYKINYHVHGASVKVKVSGTRYRRFPFIQGGLKIPVEVEVEMENSSENLQALNKYNTTLIAENYHKPVNGKYVDATPVILKAQYSENELTAALILRTNGRKRWT